MRKLTLILITVFTLLAFNSFGQATITADSIVRYTCQMSVDTSVKADYYRIKFSVAEYDSTYKVKRKYHYKNIDLEAVEKQVEALFEGIEFIEKPKITSVSSRQINRGYYSTASSFMQNNYEATVKDPETVMRLYEKLKAALKVKCFTSYISKPEITNKRKEEMKINILKKTEVLAKNEVLNYADSLSLDEIKISSYSYSNLIMHTTLNYNYNQEVYFDMNLDDIELSYTFVQVFILSKDQ